MAGLISGVRGGTGALGNGRVLGGIGGRRSGGKPRRGRRRWCSCFRRMDIFLP